MPGHDTGYGYSSHSFHPPSLSWVSSPAWQRTVTISLPDPTSRWFPCASAASHGDLVRGRFSSADHHGRANRVFPCDLQDDPLMFPGLPSWDQPHDETSSPRKKTVVSVPYVPGGERYRIRHQKVDLIEKRFFFVNYWENRGYLGSHSLNQFQVI